MGWSEARCDGNVNDFVICQHVSSARYNCISGAEIQKANLISITLGRSTRCSPDIV